MANEIIGIEDGSFSASYTVEKKEKNRITVKKFDITYYIIAENCGQTDDDIRLTTNLPRIGDFLRSAYCISVSPEEESTIVHPKTGVPTILWKVKCSFSSDYDAENTHEESDDPVDWPIKIRWTGEVEEEHLEKDAITGDPIQTEADEPLFTTTPVVIVILELQRYEARPFDPNIQLSYANHTNSAAFWGAPTGTALMLPIEAEDENVNNFEVIKATYRIKFKLKHDAGGNLAADSWKARLLHHGQKFRKAAGQPPEIFQVGGNPTTVNLTNGGLLLPPGNPPEYLEFNRFKKTNFNVLNLGP